MLNILRNRILIVFFLLLLLFRIKMINKTILVLSVRSNTEYYFLDGSQHSSPGQLCKVSGRSTPSKSEKSSKKMSHEKKLVFLEKLYTFRFN
jgi:hypothetical protein